MDGKKESRETLLLVRLDDNFIVHYGKNISTSPLKDPNSRYVVKKNFFKEFLKTLFYKEIEDSSEKKLQLQEMAA